ncbi:MAG TPA: baseplate J/gp47 family protein [Actinomycetota bacterium]|nr:baseplate J/gp47 family protein [Actinomycetota bacterium]
MNGSPPSSPTPPSPTPPSPPVAAAAACPCEIAQDPQVVSNPPGLAVIADRVDDFTGFRRALLRPLPGEQALGAWRPAPADLGLQFLEWWAYLADVLTFYNERIANEAYLRTAQFPESIAGLVGLLGYVPAPGLAATGQVGAIRTTTRPAEPLGIPAGMQLSSTATPGIPAQTFEVAAAATFPGRSDVVATLPPDPALRVRSSGSVTDAGPASVLLAGKVTGAKAGDRLLLVARGWTGTDDNWSLVTVAAVSPETDPGTGAVNTRVSFSPAAVWGTTPGAPALIDVPIVFEEAEASLLERAASSAARVGPSVKLVGSPIELAGSALAPAGLRAAFSPGRAAAFSPGLVGIPGSWFRGLPPAQPPARTAAGYRLMKPVAAASLWSLQGSDLSPAVPVAGDESPVTVNLSATVRSIQAGDLVLFDGGTQFSSVLGLVTGSSDQLGHTAFPEPLSPAAPDLVLPYTALSVATADPGTLGGYGSPGAIAVRHGFRDVGTVLANPVGSLPALPATVAVPAAFVLPAGVSTALLEDATGAGTVVQVAPAGSPSGSPVLLDLSPAPPAPASFDPPLQVPLRLLFDVVAVSRGTTVANEVLGSGNAAVANQRFPLKKSPLTHLASGAGWAAALAVYVDGIRWNEVPTLYNQPPAATVYVVERAPDQSATIRFGDGVNGSRLTSGTGNVVATYRYGSGAATPPAGRLTTIVQRQPNLAAIHNPVAASGGRDPQAPGDVKADAPASVFTFGRAISALDYEVVAAQAAGVTRAKAYWTFDPAEQRSLVKVYVNDDAGGLVSATQALAGSDDPNRPVAVAAAQPVEVSVSATLVVAANRVVDDVVTAATAAFADPVTGAFSPTGMGIGQWLYRSHLEAALSVPGVVAVHQLEVSWLVAAPPPLEFVFLRRLDQVADPGEGAYFELLAGNLALTGIPAGG